MLGALADATRAIEDERERLASAARAAERARVARELHDAVAHAMTVIVLQAGAARRVWQRDPQLAQRHAETLRKTASELITELRTMLVAVHGGDTGMVSLEQLIERARLSGLHVALDVTGDRDSLAPELQHTAYRVLQEALTNASRHAPGAHAHIRVDFKPSGLALEVANEAPPLPARTTRGGGQGLRGMRERVEACGGRLAAGAEAPERFVVRAWLPCP
jgi:signal transduction histidine kinase